MEENIGKIGRQISLVAFPLMSFMFLIVLFFTSVFEVVFISLQKLLLLANYFNYNFCNEV